MGHPWPAQLSRLPAAHPPPRHLRSAWRLDVAFGGACTIALEDQKQKRKQKQQQEFGRASRSSTACRRGDLEDAIAGKRAPTE